MFKLQVSEYQEGKWSEWEDTDYIGDKKKRLSSFTAWTGLRWGTVFN